MGEEHGSFEIQVLGEHAVQGFGQFALGVRVCEVALEALNEIGVAGCHAIHGAVDDPPDASSERAVDRDTD